MFYQNELLFLCDVFKKSHVNVTFTEIALLRDKLNQQKETEFYFETAIIGEIMTMLRSQTLYRVTDAYGRSYRVLLLPHTENPTVFYIGPFLSAPITSKQILDICGQNNILLQNQRYLFEYYYSLPIIASSDHLLIMLHTFCEKIWETTSFSLRDLSTPWQSAPLLPPKTTQEISSPENILLDMKAMERRYAFENEIIRAVTLGQIHKEALLLTVFSDQFFEKRCRDPLRNAKNYGVIMNTLLRKAAEAGGVHPLHLDRTSSMFALKIENMESLSENTALMHDMFCTYCRLVQKHSIKQHPSIVQKTLVLIESDLSADLSPSSLAKSQGISLGYLSSIFKNATQKTISEYIREKRIEYATYLLTNTDLQIQTVALHCGIMDVQYFSKLFKKQIGKTPSEYRFAFKQKMNNTSK